jgi:hypothetical protein
LSIGGVTLVAEVPNDETSIGLRDGDETMIDVLPDAVRVLPAAQ